MNDKILTIAIWVPLIIFFAINVIRLGYEMSKPPLGDETKKS